MTPTPRATQPCAGEIPRESRAHRSMVPRNSQHRVRVRRRYTSSFAPSACLHLEAAAAGAVRRGPAPSPASVGRAAPDRPVRARLDGPGSVRERRGRIGSPASMILAAKLTLHAMDQYIVALGRREDEL